MKDTFCPLPWLHLATHPLGHVSLCCRSEFKDQLSVAKHSGTQTAMNLGRDSIDAIMNSETFREVRLAMLSHKEHPACRGCYDIEKQGVSSKRMVEKRRFNLSHKKALRQTSETGEIDTDIRYLELRLGNTCNLKCVTCNPMSSSLWIEDQKQLISEGVDIYKCFEGIREEFRWPNEERFWSDLQKEARSVEKIYINGGEPTLIKKHWQYLQSLIENGMSQKIDLVYSINATYLPKQAREVWRNFRSVEINLSVDDLYERNEYIRFPSKWETTESILSQLYKWKEVKLIVLQTVSLYNIFYLEPFYRQLIEKYPQLIISYNTVLHPEFMSPLVVPKQERVQLLERISGRICDRQFKKMQGALSGETRPIEDWFQFQRYVQSLDKIRGQSFPQTFPEADEYFKGIFQKVHNFFDG
ncbi:MAG: twitch domain-containing radical SAM protein [Bdellovibrionales bacterium]|nr:twitch domain-containing radical SAM protein [Bdellovibrionales bacterium]